MTKTIEDYPELFNEYKKTLRKTFGDEVVTCQPTRIKRLLVQQQQTIDAQQERIKELESLLYKERFSDNGPRVVTANELSSLMSSKNKFLNKESK